MQIAPILIIVYVKRTKSKMPYLIHQLGFCSIENFCKDMHFFSIDQKIWHFFVKISQYFKDRFRIGKPSVVGGGAAVFRLKVRGERQGPLRFAR